MPKRGAAFFLAAASWSLALVSPGLAASAKPVGTLREIAPAIAACWHPAGVGGEITVKLGFRRDGTLLGRPRITYIKPPKNGGGADDLANSLFAALDACPLRFTPELGAAIAGRIFLIRFIESGTTNGVPAIEAL